jgi:hypothetical protein
MTVAPEIGGGVPQAIQQSIVESVRRAQAHVYPYPPTLIARNVPDTGATDASGEMTLGVPQHVTLPSFRTPHE